jgi:hypothetical protein
MDKSEQLTLHRTELSLVEKVIGLIVLVGILYLIYRGVGWMLSRVTSPVPVSGLAGGITNLPEPADLSLVANEISSMLNH